MIYCAIGSMMAQSVRNNFGITSGQNPIHLFISVSLIFNCCICFVF